LWGFEESDFESWDKVDRERTANDRLGKVWVSDRASEAISRRHAEGIGCTYLFQALHIKRVSGNSLGLQPK
jgi:hypothetical protein